LAAEIDRNLEAPDHDALNLVAVVEGEVASALLARLLLPSPLSFPFWTERMATRSAR
jgi:hypothetical protein